MKKAGISDVFATLMYRDRNKSPLLFLARGNVYYRVGGNGYVEDVKVAIRKNGSAVLYDLRNIYTKKITDVSLTMVSKSPQRSAETSVTDNISQSNSDVKEKYSRQVINSTWDDIRTKMSENGVHEDVIDEIDRYIRRLRDINVSRQEEVTGGLIPKYRRYCKNNCR